MNRHERRRLEAEALRLGASGAYPSGKLRGDDEGELRLSVHLTSEGIVELSFGTAVTWVGLYREQALALAKLLTEHAANAKSDPASGAS